jgi:hypothetical protein
MLALAIDLQILGKSRIKKICLMANLKALANQDLAKIHFFLVSDLIFSSSATNSLPVSLAL